LPSALIEVFTDPIYFKASASLALKLMNKVKRQSEGGDVDGSFIQDAVESFKEQSLSDSQAIQKAMLFIGFYSTRGASVDRLAPLVTKSTYPLLLALYPISTAMELLNVKTNETNEFYSLPKGAKFSCKFGASYHYWLSAYLTFLNRSEGRNYRGSFLATHFASVGYQMFAVTVTRDPYKIYEVDAFSVMTNSMRATVIFDDAGAQYGNILYDTKSMQHNLNMDLRHQYLHSISQNPKFTKEQIAAIKKDPKEHYLNFRKIIPHELGMVTLGF
jgi:hypothetical protein